ncbi:BnaA09g44830D [Brassica napus]|uniref:BnaA09g44830D protein n=1 Tax=Brassica napus TaxID=3708 RepID=A0A078G9N4_BRANA|nr:BnaA09g44830D [Brassica napus]
MVAARHDRLVNVPLVSPSHSFASEDEDPMSKVVSLSSTSKREVKNLKLKLISEVDKVRIVITRFDPQGGNKKIETVKKSGHGGTDVRLTFNNAILYNPMGNDVHSMAKLLLSMFEEKWVSIETPVDNRDLTLDEKRRLIEELQDLPCDKLETVVQIIKKSNPELSQQDDDEIELDIDSLDIQTLWELYRFVTGYKESLNNRKEDQGFGSERDAESAHNIIQEPAGSFTLSGSQLTSLFFFDLQILTVIAPRDVD